MSDVIANIFLSAAKEAGKVKVVELLAKLKEVATPEDYENAIKAGVHFFNILQSLAKKTKTKLDDNAVGIFAEPLAEAAAETEEETE